MPPPSSPTSRQTPPPTDPLSYLSSPVTDLASTLTHATATVARDGDDAADEANLAFLRRSVAREAHTARSSSLDNGHEDQRSPATAPQQSSTLDALDDLSRRERLQRVLARLNRIQDPALGSSATAYSDRTPSPNTQRLYDWAPSQDGTPQQDLDLNDILNELRWQQPETQPSGQNQASPANQRASNASASSLTADVTDLVGRRERLRERRRRESEWGSLRSRAVMQRARQESSPSATERMLRYVMDRERSGMSEEEERLRNDVSAGQGNNSISGREQQGTRTSTREPWPLPPNTTELHILQERANAMERRYLADPAANRLPRYSTPPVPAPAPASKTASHILENALKYLNELRMCSRYEEALSTATNHGLATKEFFAEKHADFITNVNSVSSIASSAWLQPCTIFEGHQHAMNSTTGLLQSRLDNSSPRAMEQINPNFRGSGEHTASFDHPPGSTRVPLLAPLNRLSTTRMASAALTSQSSKVVHDHWPVKVTLHSIDADKMTLQGTMEAYDVPQHSSSVSRLSSRDFPTAGKKHAPITTYLEGHIIDLATHSFLTPGTPGGKRSGTHSTNAQGLPPRGTSGDSVSFPSASPQADAANWRRLSPFSQLSSDEETARCMLSSARLNEIYRDYIFMRWKERCFVHSKDDKCSEAERGSDQDRGHGLTISGFYYVSLRRSDGLVEGLYFDPASTPYQYLKLRGNQSGWGTYDFR